MYGGQEGHSESEWHTPGSGLHIQQHRTPDPGMYGPDMHISMVVYVLPDSGLVASANSGLRDQEYQSLD